MMRIVCTIAIGLTLCFSGLAQDPFMPLFEGERTWCGVEGGWAHTLVVCPDLKEDRELWFDFWDRDQVRLNREKCLCVYSVICLSHMRAHMHAHTHTLSLTHTLTHKHPYTVRVVGQNGAD